MQVTQIEKCIGPVGWGFDDVYYFLLALFWPNLIYYLLQPNGNPATCHLGPSKCPFASARAIDRLFQLPLTQL